ncbi:HAD family hydrolase [Amycolatopsis rhizosphaerae]|uniref:HAD family hydrolase n=1 Tax=Amycolatopsis rhizosphaerae TaxID=2053003 RepID=A0A558CTH4_9PSEU|nr:HAD family hydrolase [Amycolatopsis rhizosphaerae]TVT52053.1 HAD family hydrolase [Amycolatopsis rhizosphaerae]
MTIEAVWSDVGEVLVDETREYGTWADWLGVPRHTFSAVFGAVIAAGRDYRETFQVFRPGFDLAAERERRAQVGKAEWFGEDDLYPDVRPTLSAIRDMGIAVGVAGNQTARAELILRDLRLPIGTMATSDSWGVAKPSPAFFERLVAEAGVPADRILYVGDRLDNDIAPALEVGLQTALIRRGPWGRILRNQDLETRCLFILDSLDGLPQLIKEHNTTEG